jgi:hypothetical protein
MATVAKAPGVPDPLSVKGHPRVMLRIVFLSLRAPAENVRGPLYMDQALAAFHHGNPRRLPVTLALARVAGEVSLCCGFSAPLRAVIEGQLYAQYPDASLDVIPAHALDPVGDLRTADLHLVPDLFPIKRYTQFEDALNRQTADPLTGILTALAGNAKSPLHPRVEITIRPARRKRITQAHRRLRHLARPFFRAHHRLAKLYLHFAGSPWWPLRVAGFFLARLARRSGPPELKSLDTSGSRLHEREEDLQGAAEKTGKLLFEAHIRLSVAAPFANAEDARGKLLEIAGTFGPFSSHRLASFHLGPVRRKPCGRWRTRTFLLSTEELATLWHPATATVRAPTMTTVQSREAEPPVQLPTPAAHPDLAILGEATFRSRREPCGILPDDRRRHVVVEGKTGMGKSTLLQNLIGSDIAAGRGVGLIDPHGDLCEAVLASVPARRTNDVILFDAGDATHPIAFNVLSCPDPALRPLLASGILSSFKKLYREFWGPRMEHILRNALLAVLEETAPSLLSVLKLLSDRRYRDHLVPRLKDPVVRAFWEQEFAKWPVKLQSEAAAPVQNKLGHFVSSPLLRNILGQPRSTLDLRRAMDEGKVLLVNLSKGRIGDDASALLGSFLVTAIQLAAMSRAQLPEDARRDFYLYVDEFQNFATESFATILSEARKYRVSLTIANQYLAQMDEVTRSAVFGNVGTLVAFQVGAEDAEILAAQLGGDLVPRDLLQLPRFQAYVRLLINGHPSRPFSMQTLSPRSVREPHRPEIIRRHSRHRYGRPAAEVEKEIAAALA